MTESIERWVEQICAGDRRAIAQAISAAENHEGSAVALLKALFPRTGKAFVIGMTGAPGVGKSTLLEKLAAACRGEGISVGIVATDPTSPFSGGALLGDRIRLQALSKDDGVFIRSMATRGQLGGLAPDTHDVVAILDAAGCEVIFVETVGVGQAEVDVARLADVTVLMLAPGLGDEIQTYKAGVLEIADILVVNKADQAGAEQVESQLAAMLSTAPRQDSWRPPIVATVGTTGQGVLELRAALENFRTQSAAEGLAAARKRAHLRARLVELLRRRVLTTVTDPQGGGWRLEQGVEDLLARRHDPYSVMEEILAQVSVAAPAGPIGSAHGDSPRLDHLGIAVHSLAEAVPVFERLLSCNRSAEEVVEDQQVRVAFFRVDKCRIELLEATSPESVIAQFLAKRGQGLHHIALAVRNLPQMLASLEGDGFRLVDRAPRTQSGHGKIAFLHPSSTEGVLIELVEERASGEASRGREERL